MSSVSKMSFGLLAACSLATLSIANEGGGSSGRGLVERTALAAFQLNGLPVRAGQVVTLDAIQLAKLADAGCVYISDERNAAVPKAELPPTQADTVNGAVDVEQARAAEARQAADAEIAEIDARTVERRKLATAELDRFATDHNTALGEARAKAEADLGTISQQIADARSKADQDIAAIGEEVSAARTGADADLQAIAREVTEARSKADKDIAAIEEEVAAARKAKSGK